MREIYSAGGPTSFDGVYDAVLVEAVRTWEGHTGSLMQFFNPACIHTDQYTPGTHRLCRTPHQAQHIGCMGHRHSHRAHHSTSAHIRAALSTLVWPSPGILLLRRLPGLLLEGPGPHPPHQERQFVGVAQVSHRIGTEPLWQLAWHLGS